MKILIILALLIILCLTMKTRGTFQWILSVMVIVSIIAGGAAILGFNKVINKVEKASSPLDEEKIVINEGVYDKEKELNSYKLYALFGVDDQNNKITDKSRTDCIIVAAVHKKKHTVKLMSVYRDTYVSINGKYDKINAAYAYGGPELAISTLNRNLDLDITDYVTVNFKALADAVDAVGGIELTIKSNKELDNLNDYIGNMNRINGGNSTKFKKKGTHIFDGNQSVAYSRIRYMEGGDHERANHQRLVVMELVKKLKANPLKVKKVVEAVIPNIKTSLSPKEMRTLASCIFSIQLCEDGMKGYPFYSSDRKYNKIYYGFPTTVRKNVKTVHEFLFETKDYHVSKELGKIADKVKIVTDQLGLTKK